MIDKPVSRLKMANQLFIRMRHVLVLSVALLIALTRSTDILTDNNASVFVIEGTLSSSLRGIL